MRQQIRLTESELQNIIEESVRRVIAENMEDEFNLRDVGNGIRNAFGGDVNRVKTAAKGIGSNMGKLYRNTKARVQKGIDDRKNAYGAGVNAAKNQRYIDNAIKALQQLQQATKYSNDPLFSPDKPMGQEVAKTINLLNGSLRGTVKSDAASWRNQIGR